MPRSSGVSPATSPRAVQYCPTPSCTQLCRMTRSRGSSSTRSRGHRRWPWDQTWLSIDFWADRPVFIIAGKQSLTAGRDAGTDPVRLHGAPVTDLAALENECRKSTPRGLLSGPDALSRDGSSLVDQRISALRVTADQYSCVQIQDEIKGQKVA